MKRLIYTLSFLTVAFFFILAGTLRAQSSKVVQSWDFESSVSNWAAGTSTTVSLSTNQAHGGTQSLLMVQTSASVTELNLQNDSYKPQEGDSLNFWIWVPNTDTTDVNGIQVFWQDGSGWTWHSKWINGTSLTGDQWNSVGVTLPAITSPLQRIGLQMTGKSTSNTKMDSIYVDDIAVYRPVDTTLVTQWGRTADGFGNGWPILNDASTPPGNGSIGGSQPMAAGSNGASIRGAFANLKPTMDSAVVISGQLKFDGGDPGSNYTALRYALTYIDSVTLQNQNTDTAKWASTRADESLNHNYGWEFTPRSGTADQPNGGAGVGSVWQVKNGNWASTYSNGGSTVGSVVEQAPRHAIITAGIYNWAISVKQVSDTTDEIRWYLVKTDNSYWFGGSAIDTIITDKLNGISFWTKDGDDTLLSVMGVKAALGSPITVPTAPWQAYYLDQWGVTADGFGNGWKIRNDTNTVVGDASIGGGVVMAAGSNGASLRGSFGQDITIPKDKAVILSGQMEFQGNPGSANYTALRYALTYIDSVTLQNQNTDSAKWASTRTDSSLNHSYGYEFTPRSGTADQPNGGAGIGSVWIVNNGNWASTYSNGGGVAGPVVNQAPRNAVITSGTYDWKISVQQINDSTNEVRWSLVKTGTPVGYWFAGKAEAPAVTNKLNGISFWTKNDGTSTDSVFNIMAAKIDMGSPITVPTAPWQAYYLDQWGVTADGFGNGWKIRNDTNTVVGDASIGGGVVMAAGSNGASLRGSFGQDITIPKDKAVILSGQMEFQGNPGSANYTALRYALTYIDSVTLQNQNTDSAKWASTRTDSSLNHSYGYEFTPRSGTADQPNGGAGIGSVWIVNNGNWASTYSNGGGVAGPVVNQAPRNAVITSGTYDWKISVQQINDSTNEVRWSLVKTGTPVGYWFAGKAEAPAVTNKLNGISFWTKNDGTSTDSVFNIMAAKIDMGNPITIPEPPFQPYFVDRWGFFGKKMDGWTFTPGEFTGNATVSGSVPNTDWVALRGEFQAFVPTQARPLKVTGKVNFVGGGFDASSSFHVGIFNTDSAGTLVVDTAVATQPDSSHWTGTDNHCSGYLFIPQSGNNGSVAWGDGNQGTWGAVMDAVWLNPGGSKNYALGSQLPNPSTGGAGTYNFNISVTPKADGTQLVKFNLIKTGSYGYAVELAYQGPNKFNSIGFALDKGNSITAMNITDVQIDTGTITGVNESDQTALPTVYSLSQNYPNPFNPTTTIKFGLPKAGNVSLVVYDILGRKVAELVHGNLTAGYHTVNFNASNLASGVYLYRIEAGDFVSVKKLMLLK